MIYRGKERNPKTGVVHAILTPDDSDESYTHCGTPYSWSWDLMPDDAIVTCSTCRKSLIAGHNGRLATDLKEQCLALLEDRKARPGAYIHVSPALDQIEQILDLEHKY